MIYSPSRTEAFDVCSLKGLKMYKEGWMKREADNSLLGRIVGAAFAEGTQYAHRGEGDGTDHAFKLFDRTVAHYIQYGVSFQADMTKLRVTLGRSLAKYWSQNPFTHWQVRGVELALKDYGNCRLDVLGIDPEGYWSIADLKYKRQLRTDYLTKTVNDYKDSWQFMHYPWAYNDWVAKGSTPGYEPAQRMYLVLVIAEPFQILSYPFYTRDALQARWLKSAQQKWADISAIQSGDRAPVMAASHRDAYGECPLKQACLEFDFNEGLMQFDYCQVPKLPEEAVSGNQTAGSR